MSIPRRTERRYPLTPLWVPEIRDRLAATLWDDRPDNFLTFTTPAQAMRDAPLWFVSADMTTLAVHTAEYGPIPDRPWDPEHRHGFMVFGRDLPWRVEWAAGIRVQDRYAQDEQLHQVPIRAVEWHHQGTVTSLHTFTADPTAVTLEAADPRMPLIDIPTRRKKVDLDGSDMEVQRLSDLIRAVLLLAQEPTVGHVRPSSWGLDRMGLAAPKKPPLLPVAVITLRTSPALDIEIDGREASHRQYSHRWIVRGHIRHQRVGQGRGQVREVWVPPYVKGPEDKPLVVKERVRVWRR